ncbi:P83/100 family protein [Breznakiella homolactica]|uniref:P83100 family protein n=1 Tax=Breznakiella homolactica TaxID=2798577 RepID=A0A7T8B7V5_9SPIR|nr:P83/100 family protein [Breznakiella homolactica]QQO07939.1 hypothetical protein JFL75_13435 [Breznakiella homolactica]
MKQIRWHRFSFFLFLGIYILNIPGGTVSAQQVDTEELEKGLNERIVFINYEGPHSRIETLDQIRGIGYSMGLAVKSGAIRNGSTGRYFIIHSVSAAEGDKLDADIMGLGIDIGVDHIRNLRLIIQGYLEGAYDYSVRDASLLAEYITIYNAVFRGSWNYFTSRYKTPVIGYLTPEKAGLSTRFDEWPGQTLMLIPMETGKPGSLSAVDTSSLTRPEIIEEMRKDDDRGIEQRKDMVDLKEREAEEAEQSAAVQREAIREEEKKIQEERAAAEQEQQRITEERQQVRESQDTTPEEKAQQEQQLDQREQAVEQKQEELTQREEALDEQRKEAQETQERADRKAEEAQQEREEIARDQQDIIVQQDAQTGAVTGVIGLRMADGNSRLGRVVKVNPSSGEELRTSALNTVSARTLSFSGTRILAVAGENRGSGAVRLVEINPDTLEMVKQGDDDIHPESLLWMNGNNIYAITVSSGSNYLTRFSIDLVRQARSAVPVHPYASVLFQGNMLLTQRNDGSVLILNPSDLTERKQ